MRDALTGINGGTDCRAATFYARAEDREAQNTEQQTVCVDRTMDSLLAAKLLTLLIATNGAPILVQWLLKGRPALPLDLGLRFLDGRPLLGPNKTLRGIVAALLTAWLGAVALGLPAQVGWWIGGCAMLGDLLSSFTKRRLGIAPSGRALVLDQVPEALLPLWALRAQYALGVWDMAVLVGAFFVLELALSRLLYALRIRETPY